MVIKMKRFLCGTLLFFMVLGMTGYAQEEPRDYNDFSYQSIAELWRGLHIDITPDVLEIIEGQMDIGADNGAFRRFCDERKTQRTLYVPYYQGKQIEFRNREGFSNIAIFPVETCNKPWIWYFGIIGDVDITIRTMYIDKSVVDEANQRGASWLIAQIAPNMPNIDNSTGQTGNIGAVYETLIQLADRAVKALVVEYNDGSYAYDSIYFIYDDIMVRVNADFVFVKSLFSDISFSKIPVGANKFKDVSENAWFFDDLNYVYARGLMNGTATDKFSPSASLTRGMAATVLYYMAGKPDVDDLPNPFHDVPEGKFYTNAVKWAAGNNIVLGYPNGKFGPNDNMSRQDMAVILHRFATFSGMTLPVRTAYPGFADDTRIGGYAKEAVEKFVRAGVINGKPGNRFDPGGTATRADCAAIVHRFLEAVDTPHG